MGADDSTSDYETIRKQRLEENKRRMQELGISELSQSLAKIGQKTNNKPTKQRALKDDFPIEVRRSSRVMNGPQPNYCDAAYDFHLPRRSGPRISRLPSRYASDVERIKAAERANQLQEELQNGNPSFVKLMLVSHVSGGFWLGLPLHFCKKNLPQNDGIIILEDEKCGEWDSVYLAHRTGLSGGWRGFAMDHGLEDGDAIIFELIEPLRFKVHIVKASGMVGKEGDEDDKKNVNKTKAGQKRKSEEQTKNPKLEGCGKPGALGKKGKKSPKEEGGVEAGKAWGKKCPKEEGADGSGLLVGDGVEAGKAWGKKSPKEEGGVEAGKAWGKKSPKEEGADGSGSLVGHGVEAGKAWGKKSPKEEVADGSGSLVGDGVEAGKAWGKKSPKEEGGVEEAGKAWGKKIPKKEGADGSGSLVGDEDNKENVNKSKGGQKIRERGR